MRASGTESINHFSGVRPLTQFSSIHFFLEVYGKENDTAVTGTMHSHFTLTHYTHLALTHSRTHSRTHSPFALTHSLALCTHAVTRLLQSRTRVGQTWLYQISNSMSVMFERELISAYDRLFGSQLPHRDH